jgi:phage repressor protein C with HTH and peptisase S24 domain
VQAGTGQLSEKNTEVVDEVLLTAEEYKAKCFAVQISGNSMEPEINNGDIGIFEPPNGLQPAENDIVIVELEGHGQWMIKRLKITSPNKIELVSTNKDHPPIKVNIDNEKLEVKGILLRTVRKFKKRLFLK